MDPHVSLILALITSGACIKHMTLANSSNSGDRPMWTNNTGSGFWAFFSLCGTVGSLGWLVSLVWGFLNMHWAAVIGLVAISFPNGDILQKVHPAALLIMIISAPVLCFILWV